MNYPEQRNDAPPPRVPVTDGEHFRRLGYELVMKRGTEQQKAEAKARLKEVLAIQRQTDLWLAAQQRRAA